MIVLGITGGIASGKTTITTFLKNKGFEIHDSDLVVKKLYSNPPTIFLKHLQKISLSGAIKNKKINTHIIREEIFQNKKKKENLEKFIHNEVRKSREIFLKKNKKEKTKIVILDIPLLFEARLAHLCDYIIVLYLSKKIKIQRALTRKGMTKNILLKIIKSQLSDAHKKRKADFVINTSKSKKDTFKRILKIINNIIT